MKQLYYILIILAYIIIGCSAQDGLTKYENTEIVFVSGGGFSGQEIEYRINTDRQIISSNSLTKETSDIGKLSKKKVLNLYEQMDNLKLPLMNFNHPGNMYYYIKESKGSKEAKVVWSDGREDLPGGVQEFYDQLMSIVNDKNK